MLSLLAIFSITTSAQDNEITTSDNQSSEYKQHTFNPVQYAVISQTIAPDARGGGMGDVGVATDPDVSSQHWNPAKYPFNISRAGVSLSYTPWLRSLVSDMGMGYLSGYYRIGDYSAVSGSIRYFSLGEVYTSEAENAMTVKPYEMSVDAAYSLMLSEKFSIAAAVRWIYSDMRLSYEEDASPSSAFAADIAAYYQNYVNIGSRECQLGLGVNVSNIGSKIKFDGYEYGQFLPANLRIGAALMVPIDEYNKFTVAVDANKYLVPTPPTEAQFLEDHKEWQGKDESEWQGEYEDYVHEKYDDVSSISGIFKSFGDSQDGFKGELEEIQWSIGGEYTYNDRFSLRAGYHHESESQGNRKYFTVGAGFRMSAFSLDAGYIIATAKTNPLDQTLRISLNFDLDGLKDLFHRR